MKLILESVLIHSSGNGVAQNFIMCKNYNIICIQRRKNFDYILNIEEERVQSISTSKNSEISDNLLQQILKPADSP